MSLLKAIPTVAASVHLPSNSGSCGPCPLQPAVSRSQRKRRGTAAVELAVVSPLLLMLILGILEFGRMLMVQQLLNTAAREGARKAVLPGITQSDVYKTIDDCISNSSINGHSRIVSPDPTDAEPGTIIKVTVTVPFTEISWLPTGALSWLQGKTLTASVQMRKEEL